MKFEAKLRKLSAGATACTVHWVNKALETMRHGAKRTAGILYRIGAAIAIHKEAMGYYAVLTLVLVALGAAANDYRSKRAVQNLIGALPTQDPGISVQTKPDQTLPPEEAKPEYIWPVQGTVIGSFSDDELDWSKTLQLWQTHPAIDIAAAMGEAVLAAADGTVVEAYSDALYGNVIVVDHGDGSLLRYSSLNTIKLVQIGQKVLQGDVISSVGACDAEADLGAHVHLEYYENGQPMDFSLQVDGDGADGLQN